MIDVTNHPFALWCTEHFPTESAPFVVYLKERLCALGEITVRAKQVCGEPYWTVTASMPLNGLTIGADLIFHNVQLETMRVESMASFVEGRVVEKLASYFAQAVRREV